MNKRIFEMMYKISKLSSEELERRMELEQKCIQYLGDNANYNIAQIVLDRLLLNNYRLFGRADVKFDSRLTVFIGENGSGKSSLLEAIAKHLSWVVSRISKRNSKGVLLKENDVKIDQKILPANPAEVTAVFLRSDGSSFSATLRSAIGIATGKVESEVTAYSDFGEFIRKLRELDGDVALPMFAYYPVNERRNSTVKINKSNLLDFDAGRIFTNSLSGKGISFQDWFIFKSKIKNSSENQDEREIASVQIDLVSHALRNAIPGLSSIEYTTKSGLDEVWISFKDHKVPFDWLSDGQKSFVNLISDIAFRLIVLNSRSKNPLNGSGIVLIDEIELHLHPAWQQIVLHNLINVFKGLQFIVCTHSPQTLTTVDRAQIRILKGIAEDEEANIVTYPEEQSKGRSGDDVMAFIMNINPMPNIEEAKLVDTCNELLLNGHFEEAREWLKKIEKHFGSTSQEFLRMEGLANLIEKRQNEKHQKN